MAIIFNVSDGKRKKSYKLEELLTIGRSPQNDIVIDSEKVSSFHGQFYLSKGTIFYKDLASKNGSQINGEKVIVCRFYIEDRILIGEVVVTIERKQLTEVELKKLTKFPSID